MILLAYKNGLRPVDVLGVRGDVFSGMCAGEIFEHASAMREAQEDRLEESSLLAVWLLSPHVGKGKKLKPSDLFKRSNAPRTKSLAEIRNEFGSISEFVKQNTTKEMQG